VAIRRSSTGDVQHLIAELAATKGDAALRRETAIARLRVLGARAERQVLDALSRAADADEQVALLRVLEGRRAPTVVEMTLHHLGASDAGVRVAAIAVARALLDEERGPEVLDRVTALATDGGEPASVRLAAITVLTELPTRTVGPVLAGLQTDPDPAIRLASAPRAGQSDEPGVEVEQAATGELPADPQRLVDALARDGDIVPLPTLHRLLTTLRDRETAEQRESRRTDLGVLRGTVHQILARRDSRVALYDLRETLEAADRPLPPSYLAALTAIGDASCLDAFGVAYTRAAGWPDSAEWRAALANAARAIIVRERLSRRHAALRRLRSRWGEAFSALVP
jgi:hypothetical protein